MKWKFIDNTDERIKLLSSALRLPLSLEDRAQEEAIVSEYLRDCIYKLTNYEGESYQENRTVHTKKIRHVLNHQLGAIWPQRNPSQLGRLNGAGQGLSKSPLDLDSIKNKLKNLQLIGDILHIGNGYWIPAPIRLVQLPDQENIALIGGCATQYAYNIIDSRSIFQAGLGRLTKKEIIRKTTIEKKELWQPYEQWIGWLPKDLISWTEIQLECARKKGGSTSFSFENYEIFASFQSRRTSRSAWLRADEVSGELPDNIVLLCKTRDQPVSYFLGVFNKGQLLKEFPLRDKESTAWLRLGLRVLHGRRPYGRWNGGRLKVYPPLPTSLERHVLLYAYKAKSPEETVYYVLTEHKEKVEEFLKKYGFSFIKSRGGTV